MTRQPSQPAIFTISLDFELYWGVRDKVELDAYRARLLGAREVIPRLLEMFARSGVHATWATVGFLFFDEKDELLAHLPAEKPSYANRRRSPYDHVLHIGPNERKDPCHYARSLVLRILQYPGQEVGTHTFSHYYCLEDGQTIEQFRADLGAAQAAARQLGIKLRSLVFPRNQWHPDYLDACADAAIHAVRGNERAWMYRAEAGAASGSLKRALRLADSYLNISGHHGQQALRCAEGVIDVPSSRFLRPFSQRLAPLDPLRLRRIRGSMRDAAENGRIFHLWWHPHNFGLNQEENLQILSQILDHFRMLAADCGMVSRSMGELIPQDIAARRPNAAHLTHAGRHHVAPEVT